MDVKSSVHRRVTLSSGPGGSSFQRVFEEPWWPTMKWGSCQNVGIQGELVSVPSKQYHPLGEPRGHMASALDSPSPALCRSAEASPPLAEINVDCETLSTSYLWWILASFVLVQCEGTGKTAHALIKTRHIWISKPSIRASSVKGLKCNLGASGVRWKWHNFRNFQVSFPRQKILSWPKATLPAVSSYRGHPAAWSLEMVSWPGKWGVRSHEREPVSSKETECVIWDLPGGQGVPHTWGQAFSPCSQGWANLLQVGGAP